MLSGLSLRQICREHYFVLKLSIRSDKTRKQYGFALDNFAECLGREPRLDDLTDDSLARFTHWLLAQEFEVRTVNDRIGRITALWRWLAKRGEVRCFPTALPLPVPEKVPRAWREDELRSLFASFAAERGNVYGIPAPDYWLCLGGWLWNTGARAGETFALEWSMLDLPRGVATVPASVRKGHRKTAVYKLWPSTVLLLHRIIRPARRLVFPFSNHFTFYHRFGRILERAGLPNDRYSKCQGLRVSFATWTKIMGGDATAALMHSSEAVTRRAYLDPRLLMDKSVELFCPWDANGK